MRCPSGLDLESRWPGGQEARRDSWVPSRKARVYVATYYLGTYLETYLRGSLVGTQEARRYYGGPFAE